ncbi:dihydroxyacetone kinase, C-terminal domain [Rhizobium mongolense subsp. loessense]|uniref:Dihydroxyacetone kinase, C-terminal domain n=1 Tax=Rhizobium mongolense subsp. loessense TaxID=158890 RepID=A0A1G4SBS9_9HYPH|nr:DAK2 domain-containing protein [Rhizobium mongolense]SCW66672.1 dihydroxyacetone kinase, C-terminal domain [Rhizobium mongolense subsp. loessense]
MTCLTSNDLWLFVQRAANATTILEERLNAADRELGDGDTGTMLARLLQALAGVDIRGTSLSEALNTLAFTASASTGSSLGTLISAALFAMSQQTKSHTGPLPAPESAALLRSARDAMLELGKSRLGDKTIIDSVDAVAVSIAGLNDWAAIMNTAVEAAEAVILQFRGRPCRVGRARIWPEKSRNLDDPGMVAFAALLKATALADRYGQSPSLL